MKLEDFNLLKPKEWLAMSGGVAVSLLIYMMFMQPSLLLVSDYEGAKTDKHNASIELDGARTKLEQLQQQITRDRERLAETGGAAPSTREKDHLITRLIGLADVSHITVDQYSPIDVIDEGDHLAIYVQFTGRGVFGGILSYFHQVETEIDFVDVTHFTIRSLSQEETASECLVTWSCRINAVQADGVRTSLGDPGGTALREVARHEP